MEFIQENENINEVAIKALDALMRSSAGELEIKTVQPIAISHVNSSLSEDARTIIQYADASIKVLDDLEQELAGGRSSSTSANDPYLLYLKAKTDDISAYLIESKSITDDLVRSVLVNTNSKSDISCETLKKLSSMLPGYGEADTDCSSDIDDGFLNEIVASIDDAESALSDLKDRLEDFVEAFDDATIGAVHELKCAIMRTRELANQYLTYLYMGLNLDVSFLELWPVHAKTDGMTLERALTDAVVVGDSFAFADDARSIAGATGLFLLRNKTLGALSINILNGGTEEISGIIDVAENITLIPHEPLKPLDWASATGPYHELTFGVKTYLTPSGALAIRLELWGPGIGGIKHNTGYFEGIEHILSTPSYTGSEHIRTEAYNGSFIKGEVTEGLITKTVTTWTDTEESSQIKAANTYERVILKRPMTANVQFSYENLSWDPVSYNFDIEHSIITKNSTYILNLSQSSDVHDNRALNSILLGTIFSGRSDLYGGVRGAIESRLDELLDGYEYKLEASDDCGVLFEINREKEPVGRQGLAKYYFIGDCSLGTIKLTVWRG